MITASLHTWEKERQLWPEWLKQGAAYLAATDFQQMEGRYPIVGENMYASVSSYETKDCKEQRAEAHRRYIDIQFLAGGREKIGQCILKPEYPVLEDRLATQDVIFYQVEKNENWLILDEMEKSFSVFFPWDVHRPGCSAKDHRQVKKVVIKVLWDWAKNI